MPAARESPIAKLQIPTQPGEMIGRANQRTHTSMPHSPGNASDGSGDRVDQTLAGRAGWEACATSRKPRAAPPLRRGILCRQILTLPFSPHPSWSGRFRPSTKSTGRPAGNHPYA
jgi:hypothetical protein